ncbi:hypothetical protein ACNQFN_11115 [Thauera butanivorans]|jgi:hypothetical protein|uniref:hypothetical protein n=1 Tax=Thauera butanivorans TaxID=86174 RepID=UPI003AB54181
MNDLELILPDSLLTERRDPAATPNGVTESPTVEEEGEVVIDARHRIVLRCGKSSLTLHANGKIVLRGEYILTEAEDVNRIAGGRIELN